MDRQSMDCQALEQTFRADIAVALGCRWAPAVFGEHMLVVEDEGKTGRIQHRRSVRPRRVLFLETVVDEELGCPCLRLRDLEATAPGEGFGVAAVAFARTFCDEQRLPLVVESADSRFWERPEYSWLCAHTEPASGERWLTYRQPDWDAFAPDWLSTPNRQVTAALSVPTVV